MLRLVRVVDQSLGYVAPSTTSSHSHEHEHLSPEEAHAAHHASQSTPSSIPSSLSNLYYTSTVQEKWIDHPDEYAKFERESWRKEGERAVEEANRDSLRDAGGDVDRGMRMREKAKEEEEEMEIDENDL